MRYHLIGATTTIERRRISQSVRMIDIRLHQANQKEKVSLHRFHPIASFTHWPKQKSQGLDEWIRGFHSQNDPQRRSVFVKLSSQSICFTKLICGLSLNRQHPSFYLAACRSFFPSGCPLFLLAWPVWCVWGWQLSEVLWCVRQGQNSGRDRVFSLSLSVEPMAALLVERATHPDGPRNDQKFVLQRSGRARPTGEVRQGSTDKDPLGGSTIRMRKQARLFWLLI